MAIRLSVTFEKEDLAKYPFTKDALDYIKEIGFSLEELRGGYGRDILWRAVKRITNAVTKGYDNVLSGDYDLELLSFPTSILIIGLLKDDYLARSFSVGEAKRVFNFLKEEDLGKVIYIAVNTFGWDIKVIEILGRKYPSIKFTDYISNVPTYKGKWKLVNRLLVKGYVPLIKEELARLIEEGVKRKVISLLRGVETKIENVPEWLTPFLNEVRRVWEPRREKILTALKGISEDESYYPPCIKKLLSEVRRGVNLPHVARFALATFLLNIGWEVDKVVKLFSSLPDFNEAITRYQVEHLAGLRGSRTKYITLKCSNMRTYGLCPNDANCKRITHPLQYYYRMARRGGA